MGKKLVAVTEIRHNGEVTSAGETLDASKFDKKQLEALYDAGAVRVDEDDQETEATETPENSGETKTDNKVEAKPEPQKPATSASAVTPAKSVAAPASKETASGKGSAK